MTRGRRPSLHERILMLGRRLATRLQPLRLLPRLLYPPLEPLPPITLSLRPDHIFLNPPFKHACRLLESNTRARCLKATTPHPRSVQTACTFLRGTASRWVLIPLTSRVSSPAPGHLRLCKRRRGRPRPPFRTSLLNILSLNHTILLHLVVADHHLPRLLYLNYPHNSYLARICPLPAHLTPPCRLITRPFPFLIPLLSRPSDLLCIYKRSLSPLLVCMMPMSLLRISRQYQIQHLRSLLPPDNPRRDYLLFTSKIGG
jgi:hypothetical protein